MNYTGRWFTPNQKISIHSLYQNISQGEIIARFHIDFKTLIRYDLV